MDSEQHDLKQQAIELSIVMPCLNEAASLPDCINKAQQWINSARISAEVIIADNGSTDGSREIASRMGARVVEVSVKGYGSALMGGIRAAQGKYIIMGDADGTYDFSRLDGFLENLRSGYDLVMGNRFLGGIQPGAMPILNRCLGNPVLSWISRLFFGSSIGDFYCGLRGFSKASAEKMQLRTLGMEFAIELVVKAILLGLRITEIPTTLSLDVKGRRPHLRPWRDAWRHIRFLLIYNPRWLFFYPGLALIAVGIATMLWLIPSPRTIGNVTYDVHTLLYAAMTILLGFQAMSFSVFTKMFGISEGLLPESHVWAKLFKVVTLEVGLALGAFCMLLGFGASVYSLMLWGRGSFGPLNPFHILRIAIPATTLMVLGCQIIFTSFFISVLWLRRRRAQ